MSYSTVQLVLHRVAPIHIFWVPSAAVSGPPRKNSSQSCERARMVVTNFGQTPVVQRAAIAAHCITRPRPSAHRVTGCDRQQRQPVW